jgi:hypothetical protein
LRSNTRSGDGFDNGKQWQANLGNTWKNRPTHENGKYSMLIDINGDGLPDRVFDRNPKTDQQGLFVYLNTGDGSLLISLWVSVKHSIR